MREVNGLIRKGQEWWRPIRRIRVRHRLRHRSRPTSSTSVSMRRRPGGMRPQTLRHGGASMRGLSRLPDRPPSSETALRTEQPDRGLRGDALADIDPAIRLMPLARNARTERSNVYIHIGEHDAALWRRA